jgi:hypothetical protein
MRTMGYILSDHKYNNDILETKNSDYHLIDKKIIKPTGNKCTKTHYMIQIRKEREA